MRRPPSSTRTDTLSLHDALPISPTEFAHAFADRCRHMVEDRIEAFALSDGQGPPRGALNVTCSIAFGERVIAPLIRHFVKKYPQVIATLDLNNRVVDLVSENSEVDRKRVG